MNPIETWNRLSSELKRFYLLMSGILLLEYCIYLLFGHYILSWKSGNFILMYLFEQSQLLYFAGFIVFFPDILKKQVYDKIEQLRKASVNGNFSGFLKFSTDGLMLWFSNIGKILFAVLMSSVIVTVFGIVLIWIFITYIQYLRIPSTADSVPFWAYFVFFLIFSIVPFAKSFFPENILKPQNSADTAKKDKEFEPFVELFVKFVFFMVGLWIGYAILFMTDFRGKAELGFIWFLILKFIMDIVFLRKIIR